MRICAREEWRVSTPLQTLVDVIEFYRLEG
jgi:hypothetical protein